jgi:tetratricopeptide (TPR) repeat protein
MRRAAIVLALLATAGLFGPPAEASNGWAQRLRANRADPDSLLALGREAAAAGRTGDAIRAYEAAERSPARRSRARAALAYQYAWAGRLGAARSAFSDALREHPADYDLRMGALLVRNWMGNHLAASRGYTALAAEFPGRPGPRVGRAKAFQYLGRRDLALAETRAALTLNPGDRDARDLAADLRRGLRPTAGAYYDGSEDSDHYRVNGGWFEATLHPHPQLSVAPFLNRIGIRRAGTDPIDETWVGLTAAGRPATRLGARARLAVLTDRPSGATYVPVTGDAGLGWRLSDRAELGLSASRFAVVSYRTWPEKITGETWGGYVAIRPQWRTTVRLDGDRALYAPVRGFAANHRWNLRLAASREVWAPARLHLGATGRYLDFEHDQDNGTWTPRRFRAGAATAAWSYGPRDRWSIGGSAELGAAREGTGRTTLYAAWRIVAWRVMGPLAVEITAGHSEGNVETGNGYDRSYAHLGVRRRF